MLELFELLSFPSAIFRASQAMASSGDYIPGAFNGETLDVGIAMESATQAMTVFMFGTQALVLIGGELFMGIWDVAKKRWRAGKPVEIAEPLAILDKPESPTSFDFEALEAASPSGEQQLIETATATKTDAPDEPKDTQTEPEGKLWTVILKNQADKLMKMVEDKDKYWKSVFEAERAERTATENDQKNKINTLWEALKESEQRNDYKMQNMVKQVIKQIATVDETRLQTNIHIPVEEKQDMLFKGQDLWSERDRLVMEYAAKADRAGTNILTTISLSNGNLVANFKELVLEQMNKIVTNGDKTQQIDWTVLDETDERDYQTPPPWRTKKQVNSPESPETGPRDEEEDPEMQELLAVGRTLGSNGDGGGDDGDGSHNGGGNQEVNMGGRDGDKR